MLALIGEVDRPSNLRSDSRGETGRSTEAPALFEDGDCDESSVGGMRPVLAVGGSGTLGSPRRPQ